MNHRLAAALVCLMSTSSLGAQAQTPPPAKPAAPTVANNPDYAALQEGKPIDSRLNENLADKPLFPEQTRAPYHKTAPYQLTEITGGLYAPWGLAFLPDGKFLVTEKLPGALRVVDTKGTISPPVSGLEALGVTWPKTGLFDLALDPGFTGFGRAATAGTGIGLNNIRERLQLLYSGKASLTVRENTPSGTSVTISVPYVARQTEGEMA